MVDTDSINDHERGTDMFDLQVKQKAGTISTNFEEIESALKEHLNDYKGIVVTHESIKEDKKDLSDLRKLRESIEDARKSVKKEWMKPYTEFESKCKVLVSMVDEPIEIIDSQLKKFEEARIAAKKEHIREIYDDNIEDLERFLPFDSVFNPKWTNASTKDQDIIYDLSEKKLKVKTDLDAINALGSEITEEVINTYIKTGNNLAMAIQRNNQFLEDKNRTVNQIKENAKEKESIKKESMGALNDMVNLTKTVTFIVSKSDAEEVENLLTLSGVSYRKVEEG